MTPRDLWKMCSRPREHRMLCYFIDLFLDMRHDARFMEGAATVFAATLADNLDVDVDGADVLEALVSAFNY